MIWQKINYIHSNPVRAGLVKAARDYQWSSFGSFYLGQAGPIAIDHDWAWPEDAEKLARAVTELRERKGKLPNFLKSFNKNEPPS